MTESKLSSVKRSAEASISMQLQVMGHGVCPNCAFTSALVIISLQHHQPEGTFSSTAASTFRSRSLPTTGWKPRGRATGSSRRTSVIARLDKLSRNEDVQEKLKTSDCRWDLIVCDEAHKMSATFFGGEIKYTKRYRLGQLLSTLTRAGSQPTTARRLGRDPRRA